jgi:hypothetical protein
MSTKNLARTVIEGGRHNTFQRRQTNANHRCAERQALAREIKSADFGDVVFPKRDPEPRAFDDKLAPARRWLGRQVGRRWDKVRSDLFQRFDTRTTAGRHILFCHLLTMVEVGPVRSPWRKFEVDASGLLRHYERQASHQRWGPTWVTEADHAWLGGRRVGQRGERFYWFEPTAFGGFRQRHELATDEVARFLELPVHFRSQQDPLQNPCAAPAPGTHR